MYNQEVKEKLWEAWSLSFHPTIHSQNYEWFSFAVCLIRCGQWFCSLIHIVVSLFNTLTSPNKRCECIKEWNLTSFKDFCEWVLCDTKYNLYNWMFVWFPFFVHFLLVNFCKNFHNLYYIIMWIKNRPRFIVQVGHETTDACIGKKHFFYIIMSSSDLSKL